MELNITVEQEQKYRCEETLHVLIHAEQNRYMQSRTDTCRLELQTGMDTGRPEPIHADWNCRLEWIQADQNRYMQTGTADWNGYRQTRTDTCRLKLQTGMDTGRPEPIHAD